MKDFLFSESGRTYLLEEYGRKERSTYDIAKELDVYPNRVRRALIHHKIQLRNRGEAQKAALESGRHVHPTEGRKRTEQERTSISEGMARVWKEMSDNERNRRVVLARNGWEAMSAETREQLRNLANEAMRLTASEGSQLERHLLSGLLAAGYQVQAHAEFVVLDETMHVDILLKDEKVAIEVDGPSHFMPIWGEETLARTMRADTRKTGLLIQAGFVVLRVKSMGKTVSEYTKRHALEQVLAVLKSLPLERRLVELEIK